MKFRNPKTGEVYENSVKNDDFCGKYSEESCFDCPIWNEAVRLMGYEVIDDDQDKPTRASILEEAKRCVCGQREQDYGKAEDNFSLIASLWEPYIRTRCVSDGADVSIRPEDVAMLMALLKIARICSGTGTQDSFVDCCGYMACGGEIVGRNMETSKGI
ncbi:DUF6378 domain-containing protein [Intestinibacillus sp. Marseille-P6563]|uniref:DUF6378 domain-containing protein n=1 Tax=Intestinibacillus sp. Marseille-P6563 TaxID=2364792 RepID=UPI0019D13FB2|nr:DUF6378 domain-containing protein [Intestinibacillus sp. Marseille-P6563]